MGPRFPIWLLVPMMCGVVWLSRVAVLVFGHRDHLGLWRLLISVPIAYLYVSTTRPGWFRRRLVQLAAASYALMVVLAEGVAAGGRLSGGDWEWRVAAALGGVLALWRAVQLQRALPIEPAPEVPVAPEPAEAPDSEAQRGSATMHIAEKEGAPGVLVADMFESSAVPPLALDSNDLPSGERWHRGWLALSWAADAMVRRGKPFEEGESVKVPVGAELGNLERAEQNPELAAASVETWMMKGGVLRCTNPWSANAAGFLAPEGYLSYRAAFKRSIFGDGAQGHSGWLPLRGKVSCEVFVYPSENGFLTTTIGLGRWRPPRGHAFHELGLRTPRHAFDLAAKIARLATYFVGHSEAAAWEDWRLVSIAGLELAAAQFPWLALYPWRTHQLGDHSVVHWAPVLVTEAERKKADPAQWLTPGRAAEMARRWLSDVPDDA